LFAAALAASSEFAGLAGLAVAAALAESADGFTSSRRCSHFH
jgi:hypothetical protein